MITDQILPFPSTLSKLHANLVDWKPSKNIEVREEFSDLWLIKVNKDRCPVCGTVEKSKADWCDPRPSDYFEEDC